MRQCKVLVNNIEAGILQETDEQKYIFTYHEDYSGNPVCIAMPIRKEPYHSDHLFPYFFNMLSEDIVLPFVLLLSTYIFLLVRRWRSAWRCAIMSAESFSILNRERMRVL